MFNFSNIKFIEVAIEKGHTDGGQHCSVLRSFRDFELQNGGYVRIKHDVLIQVKADIMREASC